jgi:hypothetical protein
MPERGGTGFDPEDTFDFPDEDVLAEGAPPGPPALPMLLHSRVLLGLMMLPLLLMTWVFPQLLLHSSPM